MSGNQLTCEVESHTPPFYCNLGGSLASTRTQGIFVQQLLVPCVREWRCEQFVVECAHLVAFCCLYFECFDSVFGIQTLRFFSTVHGITTRKQIAVKSLAGTSRFQAAKTDRILRKIGRNERRENVQNRGSINIPTPMLIAAVMIKNKALHHSGYPLLRWIIRQFSTSRRVHWYI